MKMSTMVSEVVGPSEQPQQQRSPLVNRKDSSPPAEEKTEHRGGAEPERTSDAEPHPQPGPEDNVDESLESEAGDSNGSFQIQERLFGCSVCGRNFSLKGNMKKHMLLHSGVKPFSCPRCGQNFAQKGNMIRHMKTCSCSTCGQQSPTATSTHTRSAHSGEKAFSCSECGQRFSQKVSLKTHMSVHTGEKLFGCTVCGNRFTRKVNLTKHMKVHPKESDLGFVK